MNLPLQAYCPTPDSLKNEQARIEGQLTSFEKSLWYQPDTTQVAVDSKAAKKARKSAARGKGTTTKEPASEKKAPHCQGSESRKIRSGTQCSTQKIKRTHDTGLSDNR